MPHVPVFGISVTVAGVLVLFLIFQTEERSPLTGVESQKRNANDEGTGKWALEWKLTKEETKQLFDHILIFLFYFCKLEIVISTVQDEI